MNKVYPLHKLNWRIKEFGVAAKTDENFQVLASEMAEILICKRRKSRKSTLIDSIDFEMHVRKAILRELCTPVDSRRFQFSTTRGRLKKLN